MTYKALSDVELWYVVLTWMCRFTKKKVHMSEKHTKLKVLTKIIIYPESLNAVVSICPLAFLLEVYFPQKKKKTLMLSSHSAPLFSMFRTASK